MNPMVTTNKKPTIDTQKLKRQVHKKTTKENHQTTREETKRRRNEQRRTNKNKWKTSDKLAVSTHLSIITLNGNGLNAPIKRQRVVDLIKKKYT